MMKFKKYSLNGIDIKIYNHKDYFVVEEFLLKELQFGEYNFNKVNWGESLDNPVLLDLGGNCGVLAIYLALKYPFLKIYSFEADPRNFEIYQENLKLNNLENHTNLQAFNLAVTSDGNDIFIDDSSFHHSGGNKVSKLDKNNLGIKVKSITLDNIIKEHNIKKIKYFKMDIEGSEFDVIYNSLLFKTTPIEYLGCELHGDFKANEDLEYYIKQYVKEENVTIEKMDIKYQNKIFNRVLISKIVTKYYKACYNFGLIRKFNFYILLSFLAFMLNLMKTK
jgi:FkbM family methyltransferase